MNGWGLGQGNGRRRRTAAVLLLSSLVAVAGFSAVAADAKKKKKKPVASTKSATSPLAANSVGAGTANCSGKTHATGGGFAVSPNFVPPSTGLRTLPTKNAPSGAKAWTSSVAAYINPAGSGGLTTYVRCEKNTAGKIALRSNSSVTLPAGIGQSMVFNCPPGTHVISGGFAGDGPTNLSSLVTFRIIVLQSQRTGPGQWTVTGYNRTGAPPSTLTGYAVCEFNGKGQGISVASAFTPLVENGRASGQATCGKKAHVVSGGFLISPLPPGPVPVVGVDETNPSGGRAWHVGLHEFPSSALPAGASLQTSAYCKKGK